MLRYRDSELIELFERLLGDRRIERARNKAERGVVKERERESDIRDTWALFSCFQSQFSVGLITLALNEYSRDVTGDKSVALLPSRLWKEIRSEGQQGR